MNTTCQSPPSAYGTTLATWATDSCKRKRESRWILKANRRDDYGFLKTEAHYENDNVGTPATVDRVPGFGSPQSTAQGHRQNSRAKRSRRSGPTPRPI